MMLKAISIWCGILMLAIANGALREMLLVPSLGGVHAYLVSGVLLSFCILLAAYLSGPWFGRMPARRWWRVGMLWLCVTLAFEFGFGRFVQQQSWTELLEAYTFAGGNLWPLVLIVTVAAPFWTARWRGLVQSD